MMAQTRPVEPIRILFICHDATLYGSQRCLRLLVEMLPRDRYDIYVSFADKGPLADEFAAMPLVTVLYHQRMQWVTPAESPWWRRLGCMLALIPNLRRAQALAKTIRRHRIDIVHSNSLVSLEGAIAARLAKVPHLWHMREFFIDPTPQLNPILGRRLTRNIVMRLSTRAVCISRFIQSQFVAHPEMLEAEQFPVLHDAVPLSAREELPTFARSAPLSLVYLGRVSDGKRFQDIVAALCRLATAREWDSPPVTLDVYGPFISRPFEDSVRNALRDAGIAHWVHFHGYQSDIDQALANKDLLLMPSSLEPFGIALLEAMTRGIPVLAADTGAPPEIIDAGRTGFLYRANDPEDLAHSLAHLLTLPAEEWLRMRSAAPHWAASRFAPSRQVRQLEGIYRSMLPNRLPEDAATTMIHAHPHGA